MSAARLRIAVSGAAGRMGRTIIGEILADPALSLAGAVDHPGAADLGRDAGALIGADPVGCALADSLERIDPPAAVVIDFSSVHGGLSTARHAAATGTAAVIGVTGFSAEDDMEIAEAAKRAAIVKSGNMSLGVNLLAALVEDAARRLGPDFDIEIAETHHRAKTDAPSGTALLLGRAAAQGRGVSLDDVAVHGRHGQTGARAPGAIGFAVLRGGGVIGDHDVHFAGADEVVTLSHRALDRRLFARGAIAAAKWVGRGRAPGLYDMRNVLGR